jgi:TctA family transporter
VGLPPAFQAFAHIAVLATQLAGFVDVQVEVAEPVIGILSMCFGMPRAAWAASDGALTPMDAANVFRGKRNTISIAATAAVAATLAFSYPTKASATDVVLRRSKQAPTCRRTPTTSMSHMVPCLWQQTPADPNVYLGAALDALC